MLKCKSCGKEIISTIEFDENNFDVYCPECGMKMAKKELIKIYGKKLDETNNTD